MLKVILFFYSLLVFTNSYGQHQPKTILWEITHRDTNLKSYLLGTLHEVDPNFFASLGNAVDKLKTSDVLYVEETAKTRANSDIFQKPSGWNKLKWDSILPKEKVLIFQTFLNKAERNEFNNLSPLILNRVIVGMYLNDFCQFNSSPENISLDEKIEQVAIRNNKKVFSLDEDHTELLSKASESVDLNQNLEYAENIVSLMSKMLNDNVSDCKLITDYKSFNIDYELDVDYTKLAHQSPLLLERNKKWLKVLDESLKKYNCFIAVGVRHLFYKQGLIQQLRALGYNVTPITP